MTSGALRHYVDDLSVTGLTSNPSIFDQAIKNSNCLIRVKYFFRPYCYVYFSRPTTLVAGVALLRPTP